MEGFVSEVSLLFIVEGYILILVFEVFLGIMILGRV